MGSNLAKLFTLFYIQICVAGRQVDKAHVSNSGPMDNKCQEIFPVLEHVLESPEHHLVGQKVQIWKHTRTTKKLQLKLMPQLKAKLAYYEGVIFGQLVVSNFYLFCFCAKTSQFILSL